MTFDMVEIKLSNSTEYSRLLLSRYWANFLCILFIKATIMTSEFFKSCIVWENPSKTSDELFLKYASTVRIELILKAI